MVRQVFAYIVHKKGVANDTAFEMVTAAKRIEPDASIIAIVAGTGDDLNMVCNEVASSYQEVWKIDNEALSYPNSEVIRTLLVRILPEQGIVIIPHDTFGMDLAPGLSIKLNAAYLPDAVDIDGVDENRLKAVRQEYSGQVSTHIVCDISGGAVITTRSGSFKAVETKRAGGQIFDKTAQAMEGGFPETGRRFIGVIEAEVGDVDITKSEILVSVGRGVEDKDNLGIVFDLAKAMGGDVACSRPVVDAKWLEKSRQVGTSGKTVKPKIYMALGISGSFQHQGGIKGAPFIVAINKNPKAPIFKVADVGVVADMLDFVPELTDKINEMK
ncbi:MAG: electron transfer flavoprotein subunit alpha/FixB family protein [Candidatus Desulfaltia sp.]|nr:electron transfer flavoprotein subunit alpha/FixB family protein [Candidatus Desulfaltia sp.]